MDNLQAIRLFRNRKPQELSPDELEALKDRLDRSPALLGMLGGSATVTAYLQEAEQARNEPSVSDASEPADAPAGPDAEKPERDPASETNERRVHSTPRLKRSARPGRGNLVFLAVGFAAGLALATLWPDTEPRTRGGTGQQVTPEGNDNGTAEGSDINRKGALPNDTQAKPSLNAGATGLRAQAPRAYKLAEEAMVLIHTGDERQGIGFLIGDEGLVLTAAHLVVGAQEITVTPIGGNPCQAEIRALHRPGDQALLTIDAYTDARGLTMTERWAPAEEEQASYGFRIGRDDQLEGFPVLLQPTRGSAYPADSEYRSTPGGPVLDTRGRLLGIQGLPVKGQNRVYRVHGANLRSRANQRQHSNAAWAEESGPVLPADLFPEKEGLLVEQVWDDRSGLQTGDLIQTIDEQKVNRYGGTDRILRRYDPGDQVELRLRREGRDLSLKVTLEPRQTS